MGQANLNMEAFLIDYFTANDCEIEQHEKDILSVQLTKEMDKEIMNRPFYWQYIESTGSMGEPSRLVFRLDAAIDEKKGEWIHFGSPRLHTLFAHLQKTSKFTQQFEVLSVTENTALHPWLLINLIIHYEGKQKKEELFSFGLNLINGTLLKNMMESLENTQLNRSISDYCYTISPLIKLQSAFKRIELYLENYISNLEHDWAKASLALLEEEMAMLHQFYSEDDDREKENEINDLKLRLEPRIRFDVISGGLLFLKPE